MKNLKKNSKSDIGSKIGLFIILSTVALALDCYLIYKQCTHPNESKNTETT